MSSVMLLVLLLMTCSSDSVDLPLWTPPPVNEEELTRLEEAFKRWASNTGYLPQVTFQKDVLTDVVPQKLSEVSLLVPCARVHFEPPSSTKLALVCVLTCLHVPARYTSALYVLYRMRFNFRGVYISRICNFRIFRVFKFAVAGCSGVEIFAGEIFADIQSEPVYHNSIRQLQKCKTCWTRCWLRLKMSSYRMDSCI